MHQRSERERGKTFHLNHVKHKHTTVHKKAFCACSHQTFSLHISCSLSLSFSYKFNEILFFIFELTCFLRVNEQSFFICSRSIREEFYHRNAARTRVGKKLQVLNFFTPCGTSTITLTKCYWECNKIISFFFLPLLNIFICGDNGCCHDQAIFFSAVSFNRKYFYHSMVTVYGLSIYL